MGLFVTKKDIEKFHVYFDEIGYHENNELDWEKFVEASIDKLDHTVDLDGTTWAASLIRECVQKWDTIEKIFEKKKDVWDQYDWGVSREIPKCKKKEAEGIYYLTNIFSDDAVDFVISSHDWGVDWNEIEYNGEDYVADDSNFFISEDPDDLECIYLYNKKGKIVCSIVQTEEGLALIDNKTVYAIQESAEGPIEVYPRAYYDSLKEGQSLDEEQLLLDFETRWIDEEYKHAVTKFRIYQETDDLDIPVFIAAAEIILGHNSYKLYKKLKRENDLMSLSTAFGKFTALGALNSLRPH